MVEKVSTENYFDQYFSFKAKSIFISISNFVLDNSETKLFFFFFLFCVSVGAFHSVCMCTARLITNLNNFSLELNQMISNRKRHKMPHPLPVSVQA